MVNITLEEQDLKELLKQALLELLGERQDLFLELFAEAIEDVGLARAIEEGEAPPNVSKVEILSMLEGAA
jgi:hypothetical protein